MFCNGPWSVLFFVYDYPPNQVKWCAAEKDLWNNFRLSFDNPCNRFLRTGERKLVRTTIGPPTNASLMVFCWRVDGCSLLDVYWEACPKWRLKVICDLKHTGLVTKYFSDFIYV